MNQERVGLLEVEYLERILEAALLELPLPIREELNEVGLSFLIVDGAPADAVLIGSFDAGRNTLFFWGPLVKATPIGNLPGRVAQGFAQAWLWLHKDMFWDRPERARNQTREWGFHDADELSRPD